MNFQLEEDIKEALSLLEAGDPLEAQNVIEVLFEHDLESTELSIYKILLSRLRTLYFSMSMPWHNGWSSSLSTPFETASDSDSKIKASLFPVTIP